MEKPRDCGTCGALTLPAPDDDPGMECVPVVTPKQFILFMKTMTEYQREKFMAQVYEEFCSHCWGPARYTGSRMFCQCWNDE